MKKFILILGGAMILCAVSCGGDSGSGSGLPNLNTVNEGTGHALDVSDKQETEAFVNAVVNDTSYTFGQFLLQTFENEEKNDEIEQTFCSTGHYSMDISPTDINGKAGSATISGSYEADKAPPDGVISTMELNGEFENFQYGKYYSDESILLTGSATLEVNASVTGGLAEACSTDKIIKSEGSITQNLKGSFSVSGDIGAAIVFELIKALTLDDGDGTTIVEGTAEIKSGGVDVLCSISPSSKGYYYKVECE